MNIRKDDTVLVITGKYRGKKGKVMRSIPAKGYLVVEGVNMIKKHMKPTKDIQQGGIVEIEGHIHKSNVMLVCPRCQKPTRFGTKMDGTKRVRVCKECGEAIDK